MNVPKHFLQQNDQCFTAHIQVKLSFFSFHPTDCVATFIGLKTCLVPSRATLWQNSFRSSDCCFSVSQWLSSMPPLLHLGGHPQNPQISLHCATVGALQRSFLILLLGAWREGQLLATNFQWASFFHCVQLVKRSNGCDPCILETSGYPTGAKTKSTKKFKSVRRKTLSKSVIRLLL